MNITELRELVRTGDSFFIRKCADYEGEDSISLFRESVVEIREYSGMYFYRSYNSFEEYDSIYTLRDCNSIFEGYRILEESVKNHYKIRDIRDSVLASLAVQSYLNSNNLSIVQEVELVQPGRYMVCTDEILIDLIE